jgi:hypothetical protein
MKDRQRLVLWFRILLLCLERSTTLKPSPRCLAAASEWSLMTAKPALRTAPSRWPGAGPGGHRMAAATGSRPARATGRYRTRAAARPPSLAPGRPGEPRGAGTPGRLAIRSHRPRARSTPRISLGFWTCHGLWRGVGAQGRPQQVPSGCRAPSDQAGWGSAFMALRGGGGGGVPDPAPGWCQTLDRSHALPIGCQPCSPSWWWGCPWWLLGPSRGPSAGCQQPGWP